MRQSTCVDEKSFQITVVCKAGANYDLLTDAICAKIESGNQDPRTSATDPILQHCNYCLTKCSRRTMMQLWKSSGVERHDTEFALTAYDGPNFSSSALIISTCSIGEHCTWVAKCRFVARRKAQARIRRTLARTIATSVEKGGAQCRCLYDWQAGPVSEGCDFLLFDAGMEASVLDPVHK